MGINSFEERIEIYKNKKIDSLKKSRKFGIEQDLNIVQSESDTDILSPHTIVNNEAIKIEATNQIRSSINYLSRFKI